MRRATNTVNYGGELPLAQGVRCLCGLGPTVTPVPSGAGVLFRQNVCLQPYWAQPNSGSVACAHSTDVEEGCPWPRVPRRTGSRWTSSCVFLFTRHLAP